MAVGAQSALDIAAWTKWAFAAGWYEGRFGTASFRTNQPSRERTQVAPGSKENFLSGAPVILAGPPKLPLGNSFGAPV